jgi:acetylornithine deacetylase/succinyl-diaminopimelate desuccinylase-like protein
VAVPRPVVNNGPVPVDPAALDAYLLSHHDAFVAELCDLVRIPSISAQSHPGVEACTEALLGTMARSGLEPRRLATLGPAILFGQRLVDERLPTIIIYGHYDVQPVDPIDAWRSPPFEPVVRDGRLYGRGSSDNKGQHLAQLLALRSLLALDSELKRFFDGIRTCATVLQRLAPAAVAR